MAKDEPYLINLVKLGQDDIGHISKVEALLDIPFEIKRIYWTYGTPNDVPRGHHSHIRLKQLLVAVQGRVRLILERSNGDMYNFDLSDPSVGLYVPPGFWRTIHFDDASILLSIASDLYEEIDYIRDYDEFKKEPK